MDLPTNDQIYHAFLCLHVERPILTLNHQYGKCPLLHFFQKDKIKRFRLTMDLETGLWGCLLPCREDSIPIRAKC